MNKKSIDVSIASITASLYMVLGLAFQPISFLGIQFRLAEILVGMCIIYPKAGLIGKLLGVLIVNLFSPLGIIDLLSVVVNIPALYAIILLREKKYLKYVGGLVYSILISLYVAIILNIVIGLPIPLMFVQVFISEIVLATAGIKLFNYIGNFLPQ